MPSGQVAHAIRADDTMAATSETCESDGSPLRPPTLQPERMKHGAGHGAGQGTEQGKARGKGAQQGAGQGASQGTRQRTRQGTGCEVRGGSRPRLQVQTCTQTRTPRLRDPEHASREGCSEGQRGVPESRARRAHNVDSADGQQGVTSGEDTLPACWMSSCSSSMRRPRPVLRRDA